jgi:hypothetical protein
MKPLFVYGTLMDVQFFDSIVFQYYDDKLISIRYQLFKPTSPRFEGKRSCMYSTYMLLIAIIYLFLLLLDLIIYW